MSRVALGCTLPTSFLGQSLEPKPGLVVGFVQLEDSDLMVGMLSGQVGMLSGQVGMLSSSSRIVITGYYLCSL